MPPAARVTDMHVCPMVTPGVPPIPHVGGPILPPGAPTVLIGFMPAATVTNMATCVGPPDIITKGSAGVMINFLPSARIGDLTAHGGVIVLGAPTVIIGEVGAPSPGAGGVGGIMAGLGVLVNEFKAGAALVAKLAAYVPATVIDFAAKQVGEVVGHALAGNKTAIDWLVAHAPNDTTQLPFDGKVIGVGCRPTEPDTVQTAQGIRPTNCPAGSSTIPKVYFANGINTKLYGDGASMCATMQKIADQTCAEVVGIYGATGGIVPDLQEATNEIAKNSNSKQAATLAKLITDAGSSDPPGDLNLIVHSRGGLAMQDALASSKSALEVDQWAKDPEAFEQDPEAGAAKVDDALSRINVAAYGTAEQGWPVGPEYTKLNNFADPVPAAIKGAQANFVEATLGDNDITPTKLINEPHIKPFDAHSIDDIYTKYMTQAAGPRDCNCS
jgi:uncharacterized Zn-binding protein involved in type VI secretion